MLLVAAGPSRSLVVGVGPSRVRSSATARVHPRSRSSLVRVRWPLTWVAVLALHLSSSSLVIVACGGGITPTSLERGGARWGWGGPG
jgi:hypothetical protein